jgi:hypothetical protein
VSFIDHGGDIPGYHSDFFVIPSANVGAVILTNSENGYAMTRPFIRRLFEILYDGHEEAADDLKAKAERMEAERVELRRRLIVSHPLLPTLHSLRLPTPIPSSAC